ncbi:MAG: hypothetical protein LQ344_000738 [Seirophora lacunosa]|nr:MAG: hypothetical protein LQ344_000738 [Seirophora lacunosa]
MVTGFETAGVVLAALPLIIIALEKYNEGLKPLKNFVDYKPFIRRLVNDLQTERATLKSTCELLLISLSISNTELACLLADPASSAWREQSLVKELKQRLQSSYTVFLNILEEIAGTLGTLANIIGFDSEAAQSHAEVKQQAKHIDDLCSILRHTNEGSANSLLGQFAHDQCQYEMVSISQQVRSENDTTTFHDMLLNHQQEAPSPGDNDTSPSTSSLSGYTSRLTRKARLQLAVILASTTLQLHTTPWLDSDWSGKDVLFRQGSFDSPYISHAFMKSEQPPSMHNSLQPQWGPVRNLTIFRLGILLLELSLGKPLGTWKSNEPEERYQDFVRASKLVGALMNEESQSYIGATQACIYGNFGSKAKDLNLEDDAFRRAVYEDVVLPLEQDLQYFCQGIGQPC